MRLKHPHSKNWVSSAVARFLLFTLLWWAISDGSQASLLFGIPVIAFATYVSIQTLPPISIRWVGLIRFIPYFVNKSFWGAIDVSKRVIQPRKALNPVLFSYSLSVPPGISRVILLNTISLLPGTLSANTKEDEVEIHALDGSVNHFDELKELESIIQKMFFNVEQ